ncbi:MAG: hypothetical protein QM783_10515 [Phycisphaerales bacterium]
MQLMRLRLPNPRSSAFICGSFALLTLAGCAEEVTIISENGMLIGLPDAKRGGEQTRDKSLGVSPMETVADAELIRSTPTGERFLVCQSPRHVVILFRKLLSSSDEADGVLMYNQLVSDDTKRRAVMEGEDPHRILEYFKDNRSDILDLLAAMPMGELSPDVAYEPVDDGSGKERARLRIRSSLNRKLQFTQLWVQKEGRGQYRLLWVK